MRDSLITSMLMWLWICRTTSACKWEAIMQPLAENSLVRATHEPGITHTVHPPHAQSHACATHWFGMLVVMSNTHIGGRRRGREEEEKRRRRRRRRRRGLGSGRELPMLRGRGRLVQQTMRGTGHEGAMGSKSCGFKDAAAAWGLFIWVDWGGKWGMLDEEEDEQAWVFAPVPKRGNS